MKYKSREMNLKEAVILNSFGDIVAFTLTDLTARTKIKYTEIRTKCGDLVNLQSGKLSFAKKYLENKNAEFYCPRALQDDNDNFYISY